MRKYIIRKIRESILAGLLKANFNISIANPGKFKKPYLVSWEEYDRGLFVLLQIMQQLQNIEIEGKLPSEPLELGILIDSLIAEHSFIDAFTQLTSNISYKFSNDKELQKQCFEAIDTLNQSGLEFQKKAATFEHMLYLRGLSKEP